jgi:hypothetical protein
VHRALPASKPPFPPHPGRPPFQLIILPDYPLQFEYNEVINLTNAEFSRESLVDVFQKIMVDYGIGKLRPLLQKAAKAIANKFYNRRDMGSIFDFLQEHDYDPVLKEIHMQGTNIIINIQSIIDNYSYTGLEDITKVIPSGTKTSALCYGTTCSPFRAVRAEHPSPLSTVTDRLNRLGSDVVEVL